MRYCLMVRDTKTGIAWEIDAGKELDEKEHDFLKSFIPTVYHNDLDCRLCAFDTKMPSGRWIENIEFSNDLKTAKAYIA